MSDETMTDKLAEIEEQTEPQPVQVREGRWRTRGGDIRHVTPTPDGDSRAITYPWHDARCDQTWLSSGRYHTGHTESPLDLFDYLGPIEPEPEPTITPDDVAAEALAGAFDQGKAERQIAELQAQVAFLKNRELTLGTRLQEEKAVTTKRLQQIEELRSEVSHVQRLWGESRRRVEELETLVADLRAVNAATEPLPVHLQAMIDAQAETIARLNSEIHGLNMEIGGLETQLEAVKAELVRQCENSRRLQIDLDAREQVPQAVSDRFEEGWDAGTARAVETIAEWLEPIRTLIDAADNVEQTERASNLAADIMQNLPHIMRTLTGLTPED